MGRILSHPIPKASALACAFTLALASSPASGQSPSRPPQAAPDNPIPAPPGSALGRLDSLRRAIQNRTLSEKDKRELKACAQGKDAFLRERRSREPGYGQVDSALNRAKLGAGDPGAPAIQALLERKFAFELRFQQEYAATPEGKRCAEGESRRQRELDHKLKTDPEYQRLLKAGADAI